MVAGGGSGQSVSKKKKKRESKGGNLSHIRRVSIINLNLNYTYEVNFYFILQTHIRMILTLDFDGIGNIALRDSTLFIECIGGLLTMLLCDTTTSKH